MVVRDEADVIEATLRYHLHQGVDLFVVSDHASRDGTREILEDYARAGFVHVIDRPGGDFPPGRRLIQGEWQTEMARLAATEHGADWVINSDADEFWWPVLGTLKDTFAEVPERFGVLTAPRPDFLPRPDGPEPFVERMVVRQLLSDRRVKQAHRGRADVVVGIGSHDVRAEGLVEVPWFPARILHFPMRSVAQYEKRMRFRAAGLAVSGKNQDWWDAYREGRLPELFASRALGDAEAQVAVREGRAVVDTRLRDFLAGCPDPLADRSRLPDPEPRRRAEPGALRPSWLADGALQAELAEVQLDALSALARRVRDLEGDRERARERLEERRETIRRLKAERGEGRPAGLDAPGIAAVRRAWRRVRARRSPG